MPICMHVAQAVMVIAVAKVSVLMVAVFAISDPTGF